jgi:hypothetical protein
LPVNAVCPIVLEPAHRGRPWIVCSCYPKSSSHANAGCTKITELRGGPGPSDFFF